MGTEHESTFSGSCVSLLHRLHSPKLSELARKRKVGHNPPPTRKRKSLRHEMVGPRSVSPSQRICEHPGECLLRYQQCSALQDGIETSFMLQYNKRYDKLAWGFPVQKLSRVRAWSAVTACAVVHLLDRENDSLATISKQI